MTLYPVTVSPEATLQRSFAAYGRPPIADFCPPVIGKDGASRASGWYDCTIFIGQT